MSARGRVRKAVFPAAGLGTRFLPATKAQPKEMLPLVDNPIFNYGVEEPPPRASRVIMVTGPGKNAIEDHFEVSLDVRPLRQPGLGNDHSARPCAAAIWQPLENVA